MSLRDQIGLCSVTFRQLPAEEVVRLAAEAGLRRIEWGADVHVADPQRAAAVRSLTEQAGLTVAALGSYYRVGEAEDGAFARVLETALALGAPRIRVWAGSRGSAESDQAHRSRVVADGRRIGELAAESGVEIAFEYHGNTLTDTQESALDLLQGIAHPAVGSYWQPPVDYPDDRALGTLAAVLPWLRAVHVFSWWPGNQRLPLQGRDELWRRVTRVLAEAGLSVDLLLEFIPGDRPAGLADETRCLQDLLPTTTDG
ncbi:sugar phosphate isomerase/epimerase [Microlunatus panaciterrae]|uniref:Xylose isomerase-like TIM barrel domain-containing protein n=1 Tax=Microlunatus panaciterrae TaxID=400768 RepID=A0ABS2RKJ0_9ACTN|nr:TIM barrel protein [Microlunatus panaciterrae]MBM7799524.1 hypothetical protein [Microlunatus panaciterrae]